MGSSSRLEKLFVVGYCVVISGQEVDGNVEE
jgi:hypothetical protein